MHRRSGRCTRSSWGGGSRGRDDFAYFRTFVGNAVFGTVRHLVGGVDGLSQTAPKTSPTKTRHDKSSIIRIWDRPAGCDDQR